MNIPRIGVDVGDDRIFQKICLLVDRPDFLRDAFHIRSSWWLDKVNPTNRVIWGPLLRRLDKEEQNPFNIVLAKGIAEIYRAASAECSQSISRGDLKGYGQEMMKYVRQLVPSSFFRFMFDIYGLSYNYRTPRHFLSVIEAAVVCWKITEKDVGENASIMKTEKLMPIMLHEKERALITDSGLSKNRVRYMLQEMLIGNRHQPRRSGSTIYEVDLRHYSIRNMREYYWQHAKKATIKEIANRNDVPEDTVKKNIYRYRQLLNRNPQ